MCENRYLKQLVITLIEHLEVVDSTDKVLDFSLEGYEKDIKVTNGILYLNDKNVGYVYPDSTIVLNKKGRKKLKKYLSSAGCGIYPRFKILD